MYVYVHLLYMGSNSITAGKAHLSLCMAQLDYRHKGTWSLLPLQSSAWLPLTPHWPLYQARSSCPPCIGSPLGPTEVPGTADTSKPSPKSTEPPAPFICQVLPHMLLLTSWSSLSWGKHQARWEKAQILTKATLGVCSWHEHFLFLDISSAGCID